MAKMCQKLSLNMSTTLYLWSLISPLIFPQVVGFHIKSSHIKNCFDTHTMMTGTRKSKCKQAFGRFLCHHSISNIVKLVWDGKVIAASAIGIVATSISLEIPMQRLKSVMQVHY